MYYTTLSLLLDQLYCNTTWDGWGCFNYTLAGSRTYINCPDFIIGFDSSCKYINRHDKISYKKVYGHLSHLYAVRAHKDCNANGTWWRHPKTDEAWTNYTSCVNEGDLEVIHIFGYASLICVQIYIIV